MALLTYAQLEAHDIEIHRFFLRFTWASKNLCTLCIYGIPVLIYCSVKQTQSIQLHHYVPPHFILFIFGFFDDLLGN